MNLIKTWWPSICCLCVILYATLAAHPLPNDSMPAIPHLDKLIHAVMMGGMVGAIAFDYKRADRSRALTFRFMAAIALGVCIFGGLDEVAQLLMPNERSGDYLDLVADIVGAWAATLLAPPAVNAVLKQK